MDDQLKDLMQQKPNNLEGASKLLLWCCGLLLAPFAAVYILLAPFAAVYILGQLAWDCYAELERRKKS